MDETMSPILRESGTNSPRISTMAPIAQDITHAPQTQSPRRRRRLEGTNAPVGSGASTNIDTRAPQIHAPIVKERTHAPQTQSPRGRVNR